jgi:SSS family solute:Na+ symporter
MDTILFLTIFSALGALYFYLGIKASAKVTTATDYFVANRQLGVWQISSNLIATQVGGGMLLGTAASAYMNGYYGLCYTVGMAIGFLLLASGIAARLQQFTVTTTAQLFEVQYGSVVLKKIASLLSIATLFGILIAQVVGFKSLMVALGFGSWFIVLPFWISVIAYTMIGGLRAITINDMVQLAIIIITFGGIFGYLMFMDPLSLWNTFTAQTTVFQAQQMSLASVSSIILMPGLFSLIEQDLAQRFFASRTKAVATLSAMNAAFFLMLFAVIPVYLGMQAKLMGIAIPEGANPLIALLQSILPQTIFALALCAIVAAIISTADALMNGISANITQDFKLQAVLGYDGLRISKITTLLVGISSLIASYLVSPNIIDIIISSYQISVCCLLVPLLFCYYRKTNPQLAAYAAITGGLLGLLFGTVVQLPVPKELVALSLSLLGYWLGDKYATRA